MIIKKVAEHYKMKITTPDVGKKGNSSVRFGISIDWGKYTAFIGFKGDEWESGYTPRFHLLKNHQVMQSTPMEIFFYTNKELRDQYKTQEDFNKALEDFNITQITDPIKIEEANKSLQDEKNLDENTEKLKTFNIIAQRVGTGGREN